MNTHSQGKEIYTCDSTGPTFGPEPVAVGSADYGNYALQLDLTNRAGSTSSYKYATGSATWATGATGWRLDEVCMCVFVCLYVCVCL